MVDLLDDYCTMRVFPFLRLTGTTNRAQRMVNLQAMARHHLLGQTKPVHIYRLVTGGTAEERVVQRAQKKLYLSETVNRAAGESAAEGELEKLTGTEVTDCRC